MKTRKLELKTENLEQKTKDKKIRCQFSVFSSQLFNKKGYTLIELVITMVLIGIIAYIVATALSTGIKAYFTTDQRKEALDQARIAMERMTREIRNVRSRADIGTGPGAPNTSHFCFINTDGTTVRFNYTGNTIIRDAPAACSDAVVTIPVLADNITSFSFVYLQSDGSSDGSPPDNTKRIRITLTSTISNESVTLQSEVWPRNL